MKTITSPCSYFNILALLFGLTICISCTKKESQSNSEGEGESVLEVTPKKINSFDHIDTLYFGYLGINSFSVTDSNIIIPVWDPAMLVKLNKEGNKILSQTRMGRGPGELQDIGRPVTDDDGLIYIHDQFQSKIVVLDTKDFNLVREFIPEPYEGKRLSAVFPPMQDGSMILEMNPSGIRFDIEPQKTLVKYNPETQEYGDTLKLKAKPYAPLGDVINGRAGSAVAVPYTNDQFVTYKPEDKTLLFFDSNTDYIAEINENFDTLKVIKVDLPVEELNAADKDSVKIDQGLSEKDWKDIEPTLPEVKAQADKMMYYHDEIWLKSNLRGEYDKWFVLNMKGEISRIVNLPRNTWLTHISDNHLGVRLNEVTFALYENPKSEPLE